MKYNRRLLSLLALPVLTLATSLPLYAEAVPSPGAGTKADTVQTDSAPSADEARKQTDSVQTAANSSAAAEAGVTAGGVPGVVSTSVETTAGVPGAVATSVETTAGVPGVAATSVETTAGVPGAATTSVETTAGVPGAAATSVETTAGVQVPVDANALLNAKKAWENAPERIKGESKKINFRTALSRTATYSSSLQASYSNVEQAKWDTAKVLTGHNPKIRFDVNYQLNTPESIIRLKEFEMCMSPTHAYNGALVLEQALCTFGRLHYSELAARLAEEQQRETYRYDFENALYDTAVAYVDCLLAEDQAIISKRQLELRERSLRDAEALYNAGSTAKFDVLRVKTSVSASKQSLIVAENRYHLAMARLCQLVSYPVDTKLELQDVIVEKSVPTNMLEGVDFEDSLKSAIECRPELHMLDWAKKVAEANYELAGNSANPNLSLQTALTGSGSNSNIGQSWGWNYMAGLVFSVPIYDAGERRVKQGKLLESIRQLDKEMASAVNDITLDVKNCLLNLQTTAARISEAVTSLEQAQEADRVAIIRYNAGLSTSTELLDAHTSLGLAEEALSTARYGYFEAVIDWVRAISGRYPINEEGVLDPEYLAAKSNDWYDLRKHADEQYDKVIEERMADPTNTVTNAKFHDYWREQRERMHQSGYKRAGVTPEEDAVLKSGLKNL